MRLSRRLLPVLVLVFAAPVLASDAPPDEEAVRRVVVDAYVDGVHNFRDAAAIRKGFHPDFEMLVLKDGKLEKLPLEAWIERLGTTPEKPAEARAKGTRPVTAEFTRLEVAGDAAFCRLEVSRDGKRVFTDFLALYRFADGWKIVGKSYYRWGE